MKHAIFVAAAATALALTPAISAAQQGPDYPSYKPGPEVRNGYAAEEILDAPIRGAQGETIGEVSDIVIGPDGQLRRLIVGVNQGFLGIGGRRLAVGWGDVKLGKRSGGEIEYFTVPVTKQNVEEFGLFRDVGEAKGGKREWRANELMGDTINLKDLANYGIVTDLIFDSQGRLRAIAAAPDLRSSIREFFTPWSHGDAGWDPGDPFYLIPYSRAELEKVLPGKDNLRSASGS
jgi:sporulation protein YlmC with PRC-barrel domain